MVDKVLSHDAGLSRFAERQMRNWEIARTQRRDADAGAPVDDFITLSNICGAGGQEVARELAERLGWPLYDRELLTTMAHNDEVRAGLYRTMDERDLGWLEITVRSVMDQLLRRNDYFHRLTETVLCLARRGAAVFVGRCVDLILPRDRGLRVKLIASREYCARRFAQVSGLPLEQARLRVGEIEAERLSFAQHHFQQAASEGARFDLLVNVERFPMPRVVRMIASAHQLRSPAVSVAAQ